MTYYRIIDTPDISGEELQRLIVTLPSWRREQAEKFKFKSGKRECALSYLLLCNMLREHFQITEQPAFTIGEHGKPQLRFQHTDREIHFNLSHCKKAIACIVSDESEVGIDVECLGRYSESLANYCMSTEEVEAINNAPDSDVIFTRLWTQKEAILKYSGEGIIDDIKHVLCPSRLQEVSIETCVVEQKGYVWSMVQEQKEHK